MTTPTSKTPSTKEQKATDFKLYIPRHIHDKIMYWLRKSKNEVSGFGSLGYDEENNFFWVKDVILLKQKVTPTSTEIDAHATGKAMYHFRDEEYGMKWHWHTHPGMNAFWSNDDMEVIRSLGQQGWIMATVINDKEEIRTAFYTSTNVMGKPHDVFADDLETIVFHNFTADEIKAMDDEYTANVEIEKPPETTPVKIWDMTSGWRLCDEKEFEREFIAERSKEYNHHGYKYFNGGYIYNPLEDQESDFAGKVEAFLEMSDAEFEILQKDDPRVTHWVNKHIGRPIAEQMENEPEESEDAELISEAEVHA